MKPPASLEEMQSELGTIDAALAADIDRGTILDRVAGVMAVGQGAGGDDARASFVLGQVFEVLRPLRDRGRLEARRERLLSEMRALASPR